MWNGAAPRAGERVQVDFDGRGNWVGAVVTGGNADGSFNVRYDDGTFEDCVPVLCMRAQPVAQPSAGGQRVQVDFDGRGNWVGAVVTCNNPDGSVNVRYDDGTAEDGVPAQYFRSQPDARRGSGSRSGTFDGLDQDIRAHHLVSSAHVGAMHAAAEGFDGAGDGALDHTCLPGGFQQESQQLTPPGSQQIPKPQQPMFGEQSSISDSRQDAQHSPQSQRPVSGEEHVVGGQSRWSIGARVSADYAGLGYYHPATVAAVHPGGLYDLVYDDGLTEQKVQPSRVASPSGSRAGSASGRRSSSLAREKPREKPTPSRQKASSPTAQPAAPAAPAPSRKEDLRVGSAAEGDWKGLGYWHPCVVTDLFPDGSFLVRYEDGFEEEASPERVRLPSAFGGGAFGRSEPEERRKGPSAPRRGSRRTLSDAGAAKKDAEQEWARLEVIKAKPEDKQWADAHGIGGERGLFRGMIARYRSNLPAARSAPLPSGLSAMPISVFVRCRPMLPHEAKGGDFDVVTPGSSSISGTLVMHEPKVMVDLSKAMNNHTYMFDGVFGEASTNRQIFEVALRPMVSHLLESSGGHGTCFAYGQTGSGKTVTMSGLGDNATSQDNAMGLYGFVADEIFSYVSSASERGDNLVVRCGFLEIYRGKCFDLLARRQPIEVREGEDGQQHLVGLQQADVSSAQHLLQLLARSERTTRATAQNESSSRSHAILQITLLTSVAQSWREGSVRCKLSLVDLAGSEWAAKSQSDDRGNRLDGAEINKSLLCLKECIRALGSKGSHVPFRGSKLTQVLKDSFVGKESRTVMIANIAPSAASCEHSLNTLRYAQRVKDWQVQAQPAERQAQQPPVPPKQPTRDPSAGPYQQQQSPVAVARQQVASVEEPRPAPRQHKNVGKDGAADAEAVDLAKSLRWSTEQVRADQAAKRLLQAEEVLLAAHAASTTQAREMLPEAEALLEMARQDGNMEQFVSLLRKMEQQRQRSADVVSAALLEYDKCCAQEDEARLCVKSTRLPWE
mmetsp:Transcript_101935/g.287688  ORF Transcript_101935/g.287688 Transcript_101935/m.287688 type:complete len:1010 (-) Transcript_101935:198-3227(-)